MVRNGSHAASEKLMKLTEKRFAEVKRPQVWEK